MCVAVDCCGEESHSGVESPTEPWRVSQRREESHSGRESPTEAWRVTEACRVIKPMESHSSWGRDRHLLQGPCSISVYVITCAVVLIGAAVTAVVVPCGTAVTVPCGTAVRGLLAHSTNKIPSTVESVIKVGPYHIIRRLITAEGTAPTAGPTEDP